ncbi:hypothetical protein BD769DRAFT_1385590 [Suillus cothurnatus]|nr:hypothetical protein BD769DRAFT_1385590 [Suillus cothurnatus]
MSAPLSHADITLLAQLLIRLSPTGIVTDCTSCGGAVALSICRSDKNGNGGKPTARLPAYIMFILPLVSLMGPCRGLQHLMAVAAVPDGDVMGLVGIAAAWNSGRTAIGRAAMLDEAALHLDIHFAPVARVNAYPGVRPYAITQIFNWIVLFRSLFS